jgi:hypothetical protein
MAASASRIVSRELGARKRAIAAKEYKPEDGSTAGKIDCNKAKNYHHFSTIKRLLRTSNYSNYNQENSNQRNQIISLPCVKPHEYSVHGYL